METRGPKSNSSKLLMLVLVTSNFDDDSIKNEWASMETPFSHYKYMGNFLDLKAANSVVSGPIWPKFELVRDFMHVLVTCEYKKDQIKNNWEKWRHHFPHFKSMGAFCCRGNQTFDPICPQTLYSLSLNSMMLHINLIKTGKLASEIYSSSKVWNFVTQRQVTPKWVVWFGPKSNSTELLCLSWLPATLMMIRSKKNKLAWRHHFPIISLWNFFRCSRAANSIVSGQIWPKFYACPRYLQV